MSNIKSWLVIVQFFQNFFFFQIHLCRSFKNCQIAHKIFFRARDTFLNIVFLVHVQSSYLVGWPGNPTLAVVSIARRKAVFLSFRRCWRATNSAEIKLRVSLGFPKVVGWAYVHIVCSRALGKRWPGSWEVPCTRTWIAWGLVKALKRKMLENWKWKVATKYKWEIIFWCDGDGVSIDFVSLKNPGPGWAKKIKFWYTFVMN